MKIREFLYHDEKSAVNVLILFLLVQFFAILGAILFPNTFHYLSPSNISVMLKAIPVLGIISLGVGVLMISGEFDLSVGINYTFTGIVAAWMIERGVSGFIAAPVVLLIGIGIGLLNGFITIRGKIPSFIATLGMALFWGGMTLWFFGALAIQLSPSELFTGLTAGSIGWLEATFFGFCCSPSSLGFASPS